MKGTASQDTEASSSEGDRSSSAREQAGQRLTMREFERERRVALKEQNRLNLMITKSSLSVSPGAEITPGRKHQWLRRRNASYGENADVALQTSPSSPPIVITEPWEDQDQKGSLPLQANYAFVYMKCNCLLFSCFFDFLLVGVKTGTMHILHISVICIRNVNVS
ncbi:unnamed protein product [Soboliphyme baturini]|uniref:Homeobox domain-containing protein n=1 Tax=Soboliphyme baturini TaxID=241478 RepID=A0A183I9K9_9BILA|nr:unnamed protein product [Soboliphyme baturini]